MIQCFCCCSVNPIACLVYDGIGCLPPSPQTPDVSLVPLYQRLVLKNVSSLTLSFELSVSEPFGLCENSGDNAFILSKVQYHKFPALEMWQCSSPAVQVMKGPVWRCWECYQLPTGESLRLPGWGLHWLLTGFGDAVVLLQDPRHALSLHPFTGSCMTALWALSEKYSKLLSHLAKMTNLKQIGRDLVVLWDSGVWGWQGGFRGAGSTLCSHSNLGCTDGHYVFIITLQNLAEGIACKGKLWCHFACFFVCLFVV